MGREYKATFTGDATPYAAAANQVVESTKVATGALKDFGKGALDAEGLVRLLATTGNQELAEMAQVLTATEAPIKDIAKALDTANRQIAQSAQQAAKEQEAAAAAIKKAAEDLADAQKKAAKDVEDANNRSKQSFLDFKEAIASIGQVAQPLVDLAKSTITASETWAHLVGQIGVTASTAEEAAASLATVKQVFNDMDGAVPIESLAKGAAELQKWHQSTANLDDIAVVAARAKMPVEELAEAFGKGGEGSVRALRSIGDATGITKEQLMVMSGAAKGSGLSLEELAENGDKIKTVFHNLAEEFRAHGNATTDLERAQNKLNAAMLEAKASVGDALIPILLTAANAAKDLADRFNALDPFWKSAAAAAVGLGAAVGAAAIAVGAIVTPIAAVITACGGLATVVPVVGTALAGAASTSLAFGAALAALAAPTLSVGVALGGLVAVLGAFIAVGVLANATINQYASNAEAAGKAAEDASKKVALLSAAMHGDWVAETGQQLAEAGRTTKDFANAISGANEQIVAINESTSLSNEQKAAQIALLQGEKQGLMEAGERLSAYLETLKGVSKTQVDLKESLEQTKGAYEAGTASLQDLIDAEQAYANSLDGVTGKEKEHLAALTAINRDRKQQADDALADVKAQNEAGTQASLDAEKAHADALAKIPGQERAAANERAAILREEEHNREEDDERANKMAEERTAAEKHGAEEIAAADKKAAEESAKVEREKTAAHKVEVEQRLKDEIAAIEAAAKAQQTTIEQQAAAYRKLAAENPDKKDELQGKADTLEADQVKHVQDQEKELAEVRKKASEDQQKDLEKKIATDASAVEKIKALIVERYALERAEIIATAAEEEKRYGKTAAGEELLAARLKELDASQKEDVQKVTDERTEALKKQEEQAVKTKKAVDDLNGAFKTPQELGKGIGALKDSGFGGGIFAGQPSGLGNNGITGGSFGAGGVGTFGQQNATPIGDLGTVPGGPSIGGAPAGDDPKFKVAGGQLMDAKAADELVKQTKLLEAIAAGIKAGFNAGVSGSDGSLTRDRIDTENNFNNS